MKIRITKAIAKAYTARNVADWPTAEGLYNIEESMAQKMLYDAAGMKYQESIPTSLRMAYRALEDQITECIRTRQVINEAMNEVIEDVSHAKQDGEFVTLDAKDIVIERQIRTTFDEASIAELAEDIRENGLMQPVTVRRHQFVPEWWLLVAGERRVRACKLAGLPVLARVVEADDAKAKRMQLAENVQREDLSLEDRARAVRELYDIFGTMQAVADRVKKSKAWVSKHVALTEPGFGWRTRQLLEDGTCEDLELLGTFSKIEKSCSWTDIEEAFKRYEEGNLNREEAREFLRSRSEAEAKKRKERDEENERRAAEWKAKQEARAAERAEQGEEPPLDEPEYMTPEKALLNLMRFYVLFSEREHQGDYYRLATEVSTVPYTGEGIGETYRAFSEDEIKKAWLDAVGALADYGNDVMTEAYFKDMAGIPDDE